MKDIVQPTRCSGVLGKAVQEWGEWGEWVDFSLGYQYTQVVIIMVYASMPYVGTTPKKMAATLKKCTNDTFEICIIRLP